MNTETSKTLDKYAQDKYKYGFVTNIDTDRPKKGLDEEIIKYISQKKNEPEWMLSWRLDCYKKWLKMSDPQWANLKYPEIDYQDIYYYSEFNNVLCGEINSQCEVKIVREKDT